MVDEKPKKDKSETEKFVENMLKSSQEKRAAEPEKASVEHQGVESEVKGIIEKIQKNEMKLKKR